MDIIVELVVQLVVEVLGELLLEIGFRGTAKVVRSPWGRGAILGGAGLAFGLWWGVRLSDRGLDHWPRLLWVSLVLGVLATGAAVARRAAERRRADPLADPFRGTTAAAGPSRVRTFVDPRCWPFHRYAGIAAMNLALAAGIGLTFDPPA